MRSGRHVAAMLSPETRPDVATVRTPVATASSVGPPGAGKRRPRRFSGARTSRSTWRRRGRPAGHLGQVLYCHMTSEAAGAVTSVGSRSGASTNTARSCAIGDMPSARVKVGSPRPTTFASGSPPRYPRRSSFALCGSLRALEPDDRWIEYLALHPGEYGDRAEAITRQDRDIAVLRDGVDQTGVDTDELEPRVGACAGSSLDLDRVPRNGDTDAIGQEVGQMPRQQQHLGRLFGIAGQPAARQQRQPCALSSARIARRRPVCRRRPTKPRVPESGFGRTTACSDATTGPAEGRR